MFNNQVCLNKKYLLHKSNPVFRHLISEHGLKPKIGDSYECFWQGKITCELKPAIFAALSDDLTSPYDSTYDDDVWLIDYNKIPEIKWFVDEGLKTGYSVVTFDNIPKDAITLIYEGSGDSF